MLACGGMFRPFFVLGFVLAMSALHGCQAFDEQRLADILALEGDLDAGRTLYDANCSTCHAVDGSGGTGPSIRGSARDVVVEASLVGPEVMPNFESWADQELADVSVYVESL